MLAGRLIAVATAVVTTCLQVPRANGQEVGFFEGCGELRMTVEVEPCLVLFPESGTFSNGLGRLTGSAWESFQENDRIHASGQVVLCGGVCHIYQCLDADSVIDVCTTVAPEPIPAVSTWGGVALAVALLGAAMMVIRKRPRFRKPTFLVLLALVLAPAAPAQTGGVVAKVNRMLQSPHHGGHVLVRFRQGSPQTARDTAHVAAGAVKVKSYSIVDGLTLVNIPGGNLSAALTSYLSDANVLYAEPDFIGEVGGTFPDDPYFCALWGLNNTGNNIDDDCDTPPLVCPLEPGDACPDDPGTNGADIDGPEAWDIWTGDSTFRIAVLDSGVDYRHPDLNANIWTNPLEQLGDSNCDGCPGICGVDDDGDGLTDECPEELPAGASCSWDDDENGWVDDIHGYDFVNNDGDPLADVLEVHRHGTQLQQDAQ